MLQVEVTTDDCAEGEAFIHRIPAYTEMDVLFTSIKLLYPHATGVWVGLETDEED